MKRWPLHKAYFWETAPFFRLLLPFAAGILCYDYAWPVRLARFLPPLISLTTLAACLALTLLKNNKGPYLYIRFIAMSASLLATGFSIAYFSDSTNNPAWFGRHSTQDACYLVRLTDNPSEKENSWKLPVSVISAIDSGKITPATGRAFLYSYKDRFPMLLHKGDTLLVPGNWQPIKNAGNPFEFDYATFCRRNNIRCQQFCPSRNIRLYAAANPTHTPFLDRAHDFCMRQLATYLPNPETKGLIQAMLLGDEVNLDPELLQSYAQTGIVHIIAISGGNVAIFFVAISLLLRWLRHRRHLWIRYAIALPLVWFYVLMAGANPSAIRAAVMFSLLAVGITFRKNNNSLNQLLATAFLLLCAQPMWLFSVGFQLSFVAVCSLILFYSPVYRWVAPRHFITKGLWSTVAASIAAEILVAPLVVCYFHIFPLMFLVANVAAYLFMSVVLYLSMAIIFFCYIPPLAGLIGSCTTWIVTRFDTLVSWLQTLNPPSFRFLAITGPELILLYVTISALAVSLLKKQKAALFTAFTAACLFLVLLCAGQWQSLHQRRLVVYNTPGTSQVELITANHYRVLCSDTVNPEKTAYIVKPAHIGWRSWRQDPTAPANEISIVHNTSVLLLNHSIDTASRFHVDCLVINYPGKCDPAGLQHIFSPRVLVIGNGVSRWQQQALKQSFTNKNMRLHCVSIDGAFVLQ